MSLLIVDDSQDSLLLIQFILERNGYTDIIMAQSAKEAFQYLGVGCNNVDKSEIKLILLDIVMPEISGIEACKKIKAKSHLSDIPIIIVTSKTDDKSLKQSFDAGAVDFIMKPIREAELMVRVKSVLDLKQEMDRRIKLTNQLELLNKQLHKQSLIDGLTNIANRRHFDYVLDKELKRAYRNKTSISLIMLDIDYFKNYNDCYGHQCGDDCLIKVANIIDNLVNRSSDLFARYGGEEFGIILPETNSENALQLANKIRITIKDHEIEHGNSVLADHLTISSGIASIVPRENLSPKELIKMADQALYFAKRSGRDRVQIYSEEIINN